MELTIKNVREALKQLDKCPICGDDAEMSAATHIKTGQTVINIFCPTCGAKADLGEFLVELENKVQRNGL